MTYAGALNSKSTSAEAVADFAFPSTYVITIPLDIIAEAVFTDLTSV